MKKISLIDIGTNSVRMIILDESDKSCIQAVKNVETTRIGSGVDETKQISEAAMSRTVKALQAYKNKAIEENVDEIYAIATSAVRDASNRQVFIDKVNELAGIHVDVISGDEEARLGFLGVSKGLEESGLVKEDEHILVVDIGGGSTELIVGHGSEIDYAISLDIGAVRLTDKFVHSDPIELMDQEAMADFIRLNIHNAIADIKAYDIKYVIGIGGTITTAGSIVLGLEDYDRKRIHNYFVPTETVYTMNKKLLNQTVEERKSTPGLQPKRADIIPAGFMILQMILLSLEKEGVVISEYDNLEGMYFDRL